MIENSVTGTVRSGFETWMNEASRSTSVKLDFGAWWRTNEAYWRLSWIENTRELCASELGKTDRFIFLGNYEKKAVVTLLRNWFDGDNLGKFIQTCTVRGVSE